MPPPGATLVTISTSLMKTWNGNINQWMKDHAPSYTVTQRNKGPEIWDVYLLETLTPPEKDQLQIDFSLELAGNVEVGDVV